MSRYELAAMAIFAPWNASLAALGMMDLTADLTTLSASGPGSAAISVMLFCTTRLSLLFTTAADAADCRSVPTTVDSGGFFDVGRGGGTSP